jgi:hypothetical protein
MIPFIALVTKGLSIAKIAIFYGLLVVIDGLLDWG